jgi:hypothetical protein
MVADMDMADMPLRLSNREGFRDTWVRLNRCSEELSLDNRVAAVVDLEDWRRISRISRTLLDSSPVEDGGRSTRLTDLMKDNRNSIDLILHIQQSRLRNTDRVTLHSRTRLISRDTVHNRLTVEVLLILRNLLLIGLHTISPIISLLNTNHRRTAGRHTLTMETGRDIDD